ncbi:hypothetical protein F442_00280 [Phytophthora nicotianae P10297]|nr:hypothetical protein F442_00280 [Phytophthora nicotianae P10297]
MALQTRYFLPNEVSWPDNVHKIDQCLNPDKVEFKDVGDLGQCSCAGDCFLDTCNNAEGAVDCTEDTCNLYGRCSNAPRNLSTLKLFDTGRVGVGVSPAPT